MNAKDALAAIEDAKKPGDKAKREDECGGRREIDQIIGTMTGIVGKMIKVLGR